MKRIVLIFAIPFLLTGCSTEDDTTLLMEEPLEYYTITIKEVCEATASQQTRYCIDQETYRALDTNPPEFCDNITFTTRDGTVLGGIYGGIGKGTDPIPCEEN